MKQCNSQGLQLKDRLYKKKPQVGRVEMRAKCLQIGTAQNVDLTATKGEKGFSLGLLIQSGIKL